MRFYCFVLCIALESRPPLKRSRVSLILSCISHLLFTEAVIKGGGANSSAPKVAERRGFVHITGHLSSKPEDTGGV